MKNTEELIAELAQDLEPVVPVSGVGLRSLLWLAMSTLFAVLAIHWYGPVRPGATQQLLDYPRFLLEIGFGAATIGVFAVAAFRAAIPGLSGTRLAWVGGTMLTLWLVSYVAGIASPALEPSMLGKREHCVFETFLYGMPPALAGIWLCSRLYPLDNAAVALRVGLAAGLIPALYMQIACMYDPVHALTLHMLPGILVGLVCAAVAWLMARREPS